MAAAQCRLLASPATVPEVEEVLRRPKFVRVIVEELRLEFLAAWVQIAEIVDVRDVVTDCRDAADNRCLELAVSGRANSVVSGDSDLLVLDPFRGIEIVTPRTFVDRYHLKWRVRCNAIAKRSPFYGR